MSEGLCALRNPLRYPRPPMYVLCSRSRVALKVGDVFECDRQIAVLLYVRLICERFDNLILTLESFRAQVFLKDGGRAYFVYFRVITADTLSESCIHTTENRSPMHGNCMSLSQ
jgi:hypothetical protein